MERAWGMERRGFWFNESWKQHSFPVLSEALQARGRAGKWVERRSLSRSGAGGSRDMSGQVRLVAAWRRVHGVA